MTTRLKALTIAAALGLATITPSLVLAHGAGSGPRPDGNSPRMERHMERFAEMDADKDGKVSADEFKAFRAARFTAADADGDGKLSAAEIDTLRAKKRLARIERMIAWNDTDGDGMLSAAEMPDRAAGRMMHLDRDRDGAVSVEEMQAPKGWFGHHGPRK